MRFTGFENSILNQTVEVASHSSWGKRESLANGDRGRWAILKDRARNGVSGAELIDFHNSIVS
jgi:hypothetical protein